MNQTTIADIEELKKGSPILKLQATVKKAFEPGEGEGQHGTWKMQAVILQDGDDEIRTTFWDRFNMDFRNLEGETLTIEAGEDGKGKLGGITVDEYKGKKQLKISKFAKLNEVVGDTVDGDYTETERPITETKTETPASQRRFVTEHEKRESIEKQAALSNAVSYCAARGELEVGNIVSTAEAFYKFLHGDS